MLTESLSMRNFVLLLTHQNPRNHVTFSEFSDNARQTLSEGFMTGLSLVVELPAKDVMHQFAAFPAQFAGMADASEEGHV